VDNRIRNNGQVRADTAGIRVALFTGAYNHIADGVSLTLNRLVDYLGRNGVEVRVFAPTISSPPIEHAGQLVPVPSLAVPGRPDYRITFGLPGKARRELDAFAPTIIHIATPDFLGRAALRYAKRNNISAVSSYHTHFSSYLKYYHMEFLEDRLWNYLRDFYGSCKHVYVPSQSMADVLRIHGINDGLLYWPRGVDTDRFHPRHRSMDWRRNLGIADTDVVVGFVSRLVWEKGLHVMVEVARRLRSCSCGHRFVIVGEGPARSDLEEQIPEAIFTGYLDGDDLATAYASSDVFFFPSETETFGNVTLEAMASGVPAVCADATGSNALVEHGVTGFLAPPTDSASFERDVRNLIEDSTLRSKMSEASRERAKEYAWDAVLERMLNYYLTLSGRSELLVPANGTLPSFRNPRAVGPVVAS
jgi:glycosyltransferase involved in cell wall biosynthesis